VPLNNFCPIFFEIKLGKSATGAAFDSCCHPVRTEAS